MIEETMVMDSQQQTSEAIQTQESYYEKRSADNRDDIFINLNQMDPRLQANMINSRIQPMDLQRISELQEEYNDKETWQLKGSQKKGT